MVCSSASAAETTNDEVAAFLAHRPHWSYSTDIYTSFGYKDNLLLSGTGEERSTFARGRAEFLLLNVPRGRWDYSLFAQAERSQYFQGKEIDHDAQAWMLIEIGYRFSDTWKLSLPATAYYYDQAFDASESELVREISSVRVFGATAGPTLRWSFHPSMWIETQALGERKKYDDGANDGGVGEGRVRVGWQFGERFELRAGATQRWRDFDQRVRYNAAGRALAGTELKLVEREGELRFDAKWGKARRWRTVTRAIVLRRRDNGSGYFSYDSGRMAQEMTWQDDYWRVELEGAAERLEYAVQTVGVAIEPPALIRDQYLMRLRLERKLSEQWRVFSEYRWERSRSNESLSSYRVNEGLLGMRWSWEK